MIYETITAKVKKNPIFQYLFRLKLDKIDSTDTLYVKIKAILLAAKVFPEISTENKT